MAEKAPRRWAVLGLVGAALTGVAALLLVALNGVAWLLLEPAGPAAGAEQGAEARAREPEVQAVLREVYAQLSEDEMELLLEETWAKPWTYDPWTGFRERPRRGVFVNIDPAGFRRAPDGVGLDHPGAKVFFFGGSTSFGYGVADGETVPARLEERLRARWPERDVRVFNFGRGHYFSGQELALLTRLLAEGHRPDLAVFLDGYNEGQDRPFFADEMARQFEARQGPMAEPSWLAGMPLARLFARAAPALGATPAEAESVRRPYFALAPSELAVRWSANRELIRSLARGFGFEARIFLQPVAGYRNAHLEHRLQGSWYVDGFEKIRAKIEALEPLADGADTFSATHLLEDYAEQPFVDALHYTPEVCDLLAQFIAERVEL
jgi:hypothetical protein